MPAPTLEARSSDVGLVVKSQALLPGANGSPHGAPVNLVWHPTTDRDKLSARVLSVVATKIRSSQGTGSLTATAGRIYEGYLLSEPLVGRGMVIFRDPNGRRMVTTAVRRVLTTGEDNVLYVETENSVYRIAIRDEHFTAAAIA